MMKMIMGIWGIMILEGVLKYYNMAYTRSLNYYIIKWLLQIYLSIIVVGSMSTIIAYLLLYKL